VITLLLYENYVIRLETPYFIGETLKVIRHFEFLKLINIVVVNDFKKNNITYWFIKKK